MSAGPAAVTFQDRTASVPESSTGLTGIFYVLLTGQSAGVARPQAVVDGGLAGSEYEVAEVRLKEYSRAGSSIVPLTEPIETISSGTADAISFPAQLLEDFLAGQPGITELILIPVCAGGTGFTGEPDNWSPPDGTLYLQALNEIASVIALRPSAQPLCLISAHGGSDEAVLTTQAAYEAELHAYIDQIRIDVNAPLLPVIQIEVFNVSTTGRLAASAAHLALPASVDACAVIPMIRDGGSAYTAPDGTHLDEAAHDHVGTVGAALLTELVAGAQAPDQPVLSVSTFDATSITYAVEISDPNGTGGRAITGFALTYTGAAAGTVAFNPDQTVTISGLSAGDTLTASATATNSAGLASIASAAVVQATPSGDIDFVSALADSTITSPSGTTNTFSGVDLSAGSDGDTVVVAITHRNTGADPSITGVTIDGVAATEVGQLVANDSATSMWRITLSGAGGASVDVDVETGAAAGLRMALSGIIVSDFTASTTETLVDGGEGGISVDLDLGAANSIVIAALSFTGEGGGADGTTLDGLAFNGEIAPPANHSFSVAYTSTPRFGDLTVAIGPFSADEGAFNNDLMLVATLT